MMSRLFGSVDSEEVKGYKLSQVNERIEDGEREIEQKETEIKYVLFCINVCIR